MSFDEVMRDVGRAFEVVGVAAITIGSAAALAAYVGRAVRGPRGPASYRRLREDLGRSVLVGLEILVAADIILTVTIDRTLESVGALGLVILVRTFLSFSLEVELTGTWPWRRRELGEP